MPLATTKPILIATEMRELCPMFRAPGHHVSSIINKLAVRIGALDEWPKDENTQTMYELASSWEDHVARLLAARFARTYPDRYIHGLELELDDITGNLDLLDTVDDVVEEVKLTAKSVGKVDNDIDSIDGPKYWHYWRQVQSYAHMLGLSTGRLHVGYYRGNYRDIWMAYRCWQWTWTADEMSRHWRMMLQGRDLKEAA